jgi:hypothetical protein
VYRTNPMFAASDVSDTLATRVPAEANSRPASDAMITKDFDLSMSHLLV